jgi:hypothetical protein
VTPEELGRYLGTLAAQASIDRSLRELERLARARERARWMGIWLGLAVSAATLAASAWWGS